MGQKCKSPIVIILAFFLQQPGGWPCCLLIQKRSSWLRSSCMSCLIDECIGVVMLSNNNSTCSIVNEDTIL